MTGKIRFQKVEGDYAPLPKPLQITVLSDEELDEYQIEQAKRQGVEQLQCKCGCFSFIVMAILDGYTTIARCTQCETYWDVHDG